MISMRGLINRLFYVGFSRRGEIQRESRSRDSLCRKMGYTFRDPALLDLALTHRSALGETLDHYHSNERLEFLGDSVLGMVVTEALYRRYPHRSEGRLTRAKSVLVSREALARQARKLDLGPYLHLGPGEERSGGRSRHSILSNAMEAVLGAIYLDGGLPAAEQFVYRHLLEEMEKAAADRFHRNYKSWLLEYAQSRGQKGPEYRVIDERGPDHKKFFRVEVRLEGQPLGVGEGRSKKLAEQEAASKAVEMLGLNASD